ncbi:two-component system sensor histidine kinase NtrB [Candidatus Protochlamydia phocaeensis]|uniref:two-component system sensor histidine kinase NtrB n=1 Tax=Candidatus Protochlamydia phocaeensis TaxID=1414722 RepID=UPI000838EE35|nr:ATP-binding protein [Candidatus Protochlamydia phocaeensis]
MTNSQTLRPEEGSEQGIVLTQAFKQFSLETERLELAYGSLQEQFKGIQRSLQESHMRLAGKLAELDFVTHYLEAILQHISQGILFIDANGVVTTYNAAAESLLGIPRKELLFHPFCDFFSDPFLGFSLKEALHSNFCPKVSFVSWTTKEGEKKELEVEATFVALGSQSYPLDYRQPTESPIQGLLVLIRNITEVRRLQQIANRHDRLKELGEMAAHLAHEIRNPLGGIKGFATLLHQDLRDRPDLQQMATYIMEGTDSLNHFVSNILNYTRPFHPHFELIDIIGYLEEMRPLLQADQAWNERLFFEFNKKVPHLVLPIDPDLFKSALLNLFVNAIQAMPEGGKLSVTVDQEKDYGLILIQDTGIGIPKDDLPKIFSPFFTTKEGGTGLGLAEVHKVIQAHQGWIEVQSEIGKGTTFMIKLPLKAVE